VKEGMTVADIGCGMGYFSIGLAKIVKIKGRQEIPEYSILFKPTNAKRRKLVS
jgi:protein-L-isoaspartate O-methyltransferase